CNLAAAQASEFGISRGSRVLQFASFSFDASVSEVFTALVSGATLCVERESKVLSGDDLVNVLREREINVVTLPPAVLAVTEAEGLPALETVVSAGESCPAEVAQRWSYGRRFINAYGPTEATVCATMRLCDGLEEEVVPIGLPMANVRVYVLDASLQPVPAGVIGELYIGGGGLARGYLRRPGATAERFIPNPFAAEPGERLYRTGDLARQRQDGQLVFAGRADQQVKVRGYRIEPGEVEAALLQHEAVSEALVVADGAREGDKRLVAYLVPREESAADRAALVREAQQHAKERLPEYMVPSIFMVLDELPLTPHGKVDRRRLPAPEVTRTDEVTGTNAPRTPVEEMLCGVAADVLGVEEVGINDNFFQAGGHSLMATQLISRVREIFQVNLSLRSFFEAPTVVGLAEVIEAEIRAGQGVQSPPIEPVAREEGLPLSFAQQRLWFLDQLEPGGSAYNVPSAVRLEGPLDLGALERTVGEIVRRHETLRTSFPTAEGRPQQRIAPVSEIRLAVTDLSPLPAAEREAAARRLAREEAERPFDLATGPLFRVGALRLGEEEHVVLFTMHHIVCDGWSLGVMVREIVALYGAYSRGAAPALPEPPIQYVDFAVWQRNWLRGDVLEAQLDFWKKQLGAGELPALKLPTDRPRPATRSFVGAQEQFTLPFAFLEKVKALSRQEGVTMFMTLLGAFQALLHRYSGQDEILVGSSIANRNRAEIEGLIGFFVNTLVMRGDFGGNPTFKELLGRVRDAALGAYAHQDLPFEKLVEEMQPERSLGGAPLFQVAFNLQNAPWENLELQGLRLSYLGVSSETSKFDLALYMSESHEGLHGKFEYATDIFEAETIRRLVGHFRRLLEAAVADPEQRVSTLPLLTEEELRQALAGPAREEFDREFCIHELFERRAAAAPESVALTFEDRHVTYAELNERAERLARRLRGCGVGPEAPVALCLERSPELVVAMLAALKAGGAYVPLDPQYPAERLAFILEDTGAPVVLTEEGLLGRLPETAARLICLGGASADEPAAEGVPAGPARKALPDNTAYIIYTSGSTGRPKGVAVSHHNLARLLSAANPLFDFGPEDVWTLFHSYAFDFSVWEIWGALLTGGRLVVTPYLVSRSPADFRRLLCEQRVTVLNQTPSAFRQLVTVDQEATGGDHLSLRLVIFGGEALEFASLRPWFDCHGDERPRLVNMYGITETTVHVTYRPLGGADAERQAGSLIGDPLADLELYVLDRHLQPVPVGVPGELYVGGAGLARGYLNRPALTAERFIPNPFSQEPGARLYRSGDVARRRADGELEYIGRGDEQVKVRGFRIELGEIEAALRQYAGVKDVLVLVNDEVEGDERLVAYVVADADARPAPSELRRHLKELLPSYMVPAAYVLLEQFPLTPNGKLDRRALPSPFVNGAAQGEPARATAGPVEEVVCGIAADVLGVERLCGEDNFFDAGGHSLLATQFILRLREALQVEVALRSVFERPRLAELAGLVEAELKAGRGAQAPPLGRAERGGGLPASFAQQRLWFLDQLEGGSHAAYNMPGAFRLRGALDLEALGRTLSEVVRRHEVLRTSFATAADGTPVQVIHAPQ
ncbi:MAG TPA: amino acid adenylation domain-containing protein, partial [Pyrinomonadaceae bacterium]